MRRMGFKFEGSDFGLRGYGFKFWAVHKYLSGLYLLILNEFTVLQYTIEKKSVVV